jgi:hypothetical protein
VRREPPAAGTSDRALLQLDFPSLPPSASALPPGLRPEGEGGAGGGGDSGGGVTSSGGGSGGLEALIQVATGGLGAEAVAFSPPVKYLLLLLPRGTRRAALEALSPDPSALAAAAPGGGVSGVIVAAEGGGEGLHFISRLFAPWMGINEDPVTGEAVASTTKAF